jgi:hypothetical protein
MEDIDSYTALLTLLKANELYLINIIDEPQQRYEVNFIHPIISNVTIQNVLFCSNHAEKMKTVMELSTSMYIDGEHLIYLLYVF